MKKDRISIIIPVLNEEKTISKILSSIERSIKSEYFELIVVDGGSQDQTKKKCLAQIKKLQLRSKFIWVDCKKGRAHQMNAGALIAKYNVLFFVHSDTLLPKGFDQHIFKMLKKVPAGCFRLKFDSNKWFLRFFAFSDCIYCYLFIINILHFVLDPVLFDVFLYTIGQSSHFVLENIPHQIWH